jgi:hypothetical protein
MPKKKIVLKREITGTPLFYLIRDAVITRFCKKSKRLRDLLRKKNGHVETRIEFDGGASGKITDATIIVEISEVSNDRLDSE